MSCNSFSSGCGGYNSGSKRIEMELTVKRVFPNAALCINRCTVVVDDSVCYFVFDMYIVSSDILGIKVKNVASYFPSTPTVSECQLCG